MIRLSSRPLYMPRIPSALKGKVRVRVRVRLRLRLRVRAPLIHAAHPRPNG